MSNLKSNCLRLKVLRDAMSESSQEVLRSLVDKSIPLDDRWEAYELLESMGLLDIESFGDGFIEEFKSPTELTLYDDFGIDRYQTTPYFTILRKALARSLPGIDVVRWKEAVLENVATNRVGSFVFDW